MSTFNPGLDPSAVVVRSDRPTIRPGRWWALASLLVAAVTVARMPAVQDHVRHRVSDAIATGELVDTTQGALAVNIAVAAALAVSLVVSLLVLAIARRAEPWLHLPPVPVGRQRLPGALLVVASSLLAKQMTALLTGATALRTDPHVWGVVLATLALSTALVVRSSASGRARVAVACIVVGAVALVV